MRRLIAVLALAVLPAIAGAQGLYVKNTEDGYLNLRSGPGTRHDILRRLTPGARVEIRETVGRWARVELPDGTFGWVSATYLERERPTGAQVLFVKQTNDGYLNFRSGPGTDRPILRRIYPGDRLEVISRADRWVQVRHPTGAVGWVHGAYVAP
ncbi:SH3 domain-containing protein [Jannaschia sp. KMU-145]|uniref:SH3 domain-containing protein n=1 Tax=Jannaschia halovivens TaxID=3388667 RepID=UPI00396B37BF